MGAHIFKHAVKRVAQGVGFDIRRMPWREDKEFLAVYEAIRKHTLVDITRCWQLWDSVATGPSGGDIIEVGVWRGGTGCLLAKRAQALRCKAFLCDTFSGVVKSGEWDNEYRNGEHGDAHPLFVSSLASKLGVETDILQGVFPEDTGHRIGDRVFRFAHIDVDVYQSSKDATEWLWPRLVLGGVVIFDDYGFRRCDGVRKFVDEWVAKTRCPVVHSVTSQAIVFKV
jgi:O-methyltransferase